MKPISRRIRRLEEAFRLLPETEEEKQLKQWMEAGRRRLVEAVARGELEAVPEPEPIPPGLSLVEILLLGRQRARERSMRTAHRGAPK